MFKENMVRGLPRVVQPKEKCTGCLMSKQTRRPIPSRVNFSANKPLELVHGDLCGPINPETASGKKYVFLLVDDYSRVMWAYLLKSKGEALVAFKKFHALVEDGDERRIKTFRTDRGVNSCQRSSKIFVSKLELRDSTLLHTLHNRTEWLNEGIER